MFGQPFSHNILLKMVIYFGTLFNNITLNRFDLQGNLIQSSKVPLNYGPREKFLARLEGNPNLDRRVAIQLPRITFEMTGLYYDSTRRMPATNRITVQNPNDPTGVRYQYSPVPYNISFTMSIMVKNVTDGTYIVEQILPFFGPSWQATLNLNPDMNLKYDVPITLDTIDQVDTYEGTFTERRAIIWTLTFTMKTWFFGPTYGANTGIIKNIDLSLNAPGIGITIADANANNTDSSVNINITPGQDANGNAVSTSSFLYTYGLANATGTFSIAEKVFANTDTSDFLYVKSSNTTQLTTYNVAGDVVVGSRLIGAETGFTANVISVSVTPGPLEDWNDIGKDSDWGFITDIIENI